VDEDLAEIGGEQACEKLLKKHPDLNGLFVPLGTFAVGARRALAHLNYSVPDQIKLVSRFDGIRARECEPPLTVVDLQLDQVGQKAVDLLLDTIAGKSKAAVLGPKPRLVIRGSSIAGNLLGRTGGN
jgi:DNA-binding LacI/PurR family transcriptional regulator